MIKTGIHRYHGTCLGQDIALWASTDPSVPSVLHWGNERLTLDRHLPMSLSGLLPGGMLASGVSAQDWIPFVRYAIGIGKL